MKLSKDSIIKAITSLTGLCVLLAHDEFAKSRYAFKSGTTTSTGLYKYGEWYTIDRDFVEKAAANIMRPFYPRNISGRHPIRRMAQ